MFAPLTDAPDGETIIRAPGAAGQRTHDTVPETRLGGGRPRRPVVPGYHILGELGRGTAGVVYKARHLRLNRLVALKVVLDGAHQRPEDLVRFLAEAEVLARLRHPNIVLIYNAGWHGGLPHLATELVEGGNLAGLTGGRPLPVRRAAELTEALAAAVSHAHDHGIVHRDLKPTNVLLDETGRPKLADFGLAKRLTGGGGLTETGALLGTPGYMAPEQALCEEVGPAADVYALGAILYELLTGRPPFRGESLLHTLELITTEPPAPPGRARRGVPRDLEAICLKCLEKEPARRYCAAGLAADLRRFLDGRPVTARRPRPWRRAAEWVRRRRAAVACCVGAALGTAAALPWAPGGVPVAAAAVALGAVGYAAWCRLRNVG